MDLGCTASHTKKTRRSAGCILHLLVIEQGRRRTGEVRIRVRERVDPLPSSSAAHEGRHEGVLLRGDVVDLDGSTNQRRVGRGDGAEQCGRERVSRTIWPLVRRGTFGKGCGGAAVAHVRAEHGLGDVPRVLPVELVLQVVDARDARAPCRKTTPCERQAGGSGIGRGDLPLRRVLHCGQLCVPSRRSYS
jgi:hypothetical protein